MLNLGVLGSLVVEILKNCGVFVMFSGLRPYSWHHMYLVFITSSSVAQSTSFYLPIHNTDPVG